MNKRLEQLSEQAEKYADDNFRGEPTWTEAFESKFAELIVRECLKQIKDGMVDEGELLYEHEETTESVNEALMDAHHNIAMHFGFAEHFGVEL